MIETMKWFKKGEEIYAFEIDGSQDFLITEEHLPMSDDEVDRHTNPRKYLTEEEKEAHRLASFTPLTRRQFMKTMVLGGYDLSVIEDTINSIEDPVVRQLALIDWTSATDFNRNDSTLSLMAGMLGLTSEQVDAMWEFGLTL